MLKLLERHAPCANRAQRLSRSLAAREQRLHCGLAHTNERQRDVWRQVGDHKAFQNLDRGVRMGEFHVDDTFLAAKALGAMGVRVPEWWTPDNPRKGSEIVEQYVAFATKMVA